MTTTRFDDLDDFDTATVSTKPQEDIKYPCHLCSGTGLWKGGMTNQHGNSKCNPCGGKGYYLTSPKQRQYAKQKTQQKKQEQGAQKIEAFNAQVAETFSEEQIAWFAEARSWNNFIDNVLTNGKKYGGLTDNQIQGLHNAYGNHLARLEEKEAGGATGIYAQQEDLGGITAVFQKCADRGMKKPQLRVGEIVISMAPSHGKNIGCLYIKMKHGTYAGKISPEGKYSPVKGVGEPLTGFLKEISANPLEAAVKYGRETGNCACCGRHLTDPESVKLGIGPVCLNGWF